MLNLLFISNMCCFSAIAIKNNNFHDFIRN